MKRLLAGMLLTAAAWGADDQSSGTEWGRIRAYCTAGVVLSRDDGGFSKQTAYLGFNLDKNWRSSGNLLINSYFDVRMTSIPVTTDTGGVSSQRAASMSGGFYAPYLTTRWKFSGSDQSLFVAPLLKAGFDTPTAQRVDHFYTASGVGVRLGHLRMGESKDSAPELISFVDVIYGHFTSFADPGRRLGIEGVLKAPGTPLVIGFQANVGRNPAARDDLRLFIGTRFDLASLIDKLRQ